MPPFASRTLTLYNKRTPACRPPGPGWRHRPEQRQVSRACGDSSGSLAALGDLPLELGPVPTEKCSATSRRAASWRLRLLRGTPVFVGPERRLQAHRCIREELRAAAGAGTRGCLRSGLTAAQHPHTASSSPLYGSLRGNEPSPVARPTHARRRGAESASAAPTEIPRRRRPTTRLLSKRRTDRRRPSRWVHCSA